MPTQNERLLGALGYILGLFVGFIGPLIIWLVKKDESAYLNVVAKEALNFSITYMIYFAITGLLCIILIGMVILPLVGLFFTIFSILAAVKVYDGTEYKVPGIFRFVK